MPKIKPSIRLLESKNISEIANAFQQLGWNKPALQYERYLMEQALEIRDVYVAFVKGEFAGYLTIFWNSDYEPFQKREHP